MIGFQELNETATSTYNYYPARSTKVNRYFVIDMAGETKDVVVTFTSKTKSGLGDRTKRAWFCTVTAMRGKKGGLTIRDMGDQQKFQETLVKLVQEFMLKVRANAVSMRVQKKGSGKMFDMRIKTLFKKLRYGCETTKILNVGDHEMAEDFSFFVINKPGYNTDKLLESEEKTINILAAQMSKEPDIATARSIIVTADMVPGFEEFHDEVKAEWIEDKPAKRVPNTPMVMPALTPATRGVYRERLQGAANHSVPEVADVARIALGTLDIPIDLQTIASRIAPAMRNTKHQDQGTVNEIVRNMLSVKSREFETQYNTLAVQLQQDPTWSGVSPEVQGSIARYTGAQYWNVNQHLLTGKGTEKTAKIISDIDSAFEEAGVMGHNIQPTPLLYRGMECTSNVVRSILKTGLFASTAYMSASTDPMIAVEFAEANVLDVMTSRDSSKQEMLDTLGFGTMNMKVVFIIESDGLPVYIPGRNGQQGENEFMINRNTVFDADVVTMDHVGSHAVIRLSVRDKGAYNESVIGVHMKQERMAELEDIAILLLGTDNPELPATTREKFSKSIAAQ
ncbi:Alt-like RNA polymerase ADP-ribosyltransferase [Vibrio phage K567]